MQTPTFVDQSKYYPFPKVTPIRLPKIINLVKNYYCYKESNPKILEESFRKWFNPLIDLNAFPYMYFTNNGITQALEYVPIHYKRNDIRVLKGDYFWLKTIGSGIEVDTLEPCDISYSSSPSSIDGSVNDLTWPSKLHILDGAYIGSSTKKTTVPNNTEIVLLGFGKNLGVPELRLGLIFSKVRLPIIDVFQKTFSHVGLLGFETASKVCNEIPIIELAEELKFHQLEFCKRYTDAIFVPSDSALLATTEDQNYKFYKRPNGVIRIPLGESISKCIKENIL
jgi:hypothetical protein